MTDNQSDWMATPADTASDIRDAIGCLNGARMVLDLVVSDSVSADPWHSEAATIRGEIEALVERLEVFEKPDHRTHIEQSPRG